MIGEDYDKYDQKEKLSEFNEAAFQILRLHTLWQDCLRFSGSSPQAFNPLRWNMTMNNIWRELVADAFRKNKVKYIEGWDDINKKFREAQVKRKGVYDALQAKEIFLRVLADDVGKGSKIREDYAHL